MSWIKLHRKFMDWEWYSDANMVRVFIHLLLSAAHEDGAKQRGIAVQRGQAVIDTADLAGALAIGRQAVRTCLAKLQQTGEITITTMRGRKGYTVVTISNYNNYQSVSKSNTNQLITNLATNLATNLQSNSTTDKSVTYNEQKESANQFNGQLKNDNLTILYNNKVKEDKEIVVVDGARAREEAIQKLRCELQSSPLKIEAAMRATRITDAAQLFDLCDEVFADWSLRTDGSIDWPHLRSQLIIKAEAQRRDAKRMAAIPAAKQNVQEWRRDFMQDYTAYINNQLKNKNNGNY